MSHTTRGDWYMAWLLADERDEGLTEVDIRTLDSDDLRALRATAGRQGDPELVASVNRVLSERGES